MSDTLYHDTSLMDEDLRRGRRFVRCYDVVFVAAMAVVLALFIVYDRPWHKLMKRVLWPMLLHLSLVRGNRWVRGLHVILMLVLSYSVLRLGLRHPAPSVWAVCGPMSLVLAWLGAMIGFSPGVSAYLARVRAGVSTSDHSPDVESPSDVAPSDCCAGCQTPLQSFVVLCPWCGTRREEVVL